VGARPPSRELWLDRSLNEEALTAVAGKRDQRSFDQARSRLTIAGENAQLGY
jgi:hypothetical protein